MLTKGKSKGNGNAPGSGEAPDSEGALGNGIPALPKALTVRGHHVYESGVHGDLLLRLGLLTAEPGRLDAWAAELARRNASLGAEFVVGAATHGAIVAQRVAAHLGVPFAMAERVMTPSGAPRYEIADEYHPLVAGRLGLIVDDAVNAGAAVVGTGIRLGRLGARVAGVAAVIVRDPAPDLLIGGEVFEVSALFSLPWSTWTAASCPVCRARRAGGTPA
jgi:orotate phosphoribosyltransferase